MQNIVNSDVIFHRQRIPSAETPLPEARWRISSMALCFSRRVNAKVETVVFFLCGVIVDIFFAVKDTAVEYTADSLVWIGLKLNWINLNEIDHTLKMACSGSENVLGDQPEFLERRTIE